MRTDVVATMTREEALKALEVIQKGIQKNAWMYKDIPQCHIEFAKNQKSSSANAEKEGEKRGASE